MSPYPANGEIVELDMLNDLIQQPVRHGVEIRKRVYLQIERKPERKQAVGFFNHFNVLPVNVTVHIRNLLQLPSTNLPGSFQT